MTYQNTFAFAHVRYNCSTCGHTETIWNSRDGMIPSTAYCVNCSGSMELAPNPDTYVSPDPEFKLVPGQRIIRDGTVDEAWNAVVKKLCLWFSLTEPELLDNSDHVQLAHDTMESSFEEGWPIIVEV
jgi:hypothetical protein